MVGGGISWGSGRYTRIRQKRRRQRSHRYEDVHTDENGMTDTNRHRARGPTTRAETVTVMMTVRGPKREMCSNVRVRYGNQKRGPGDGAPVSVGLTGAVGCARYCRPTTSAGNDCRTTEAGRCCVTTTTLSRAERAARAVLHEADRCTTTSPVRRNTHGARAERFA